MLTGVVTFKVLFDVFAVKTVDFAATVTDVWVVFGLAVEVIAPELFIFVARVESFAFVVFGVGECFGDSVKNF